MHKHDNRQQQSHHHGHEHDRGVRGLLRYLRLLPKMWRSEVNDEVVRRVAPMPGERVVDLGAGMGAATVEAARSGAAVIAVDPMPYMRRLLGLRLRMQRAGASVTVVDGAAESIPVADGSIDALWTVNTIHHWTQRSAAAQELARVLRPGGRVMLVDEDFFDPAHPMYELAQARLTRHRHHFEEVDPAVVAAELIGAGFSTAEGARSTIAGRPVKVIRATR